MNRQEIFEWVKATYGTEPDYPWNDWNAVLRHKDNNKAAERIFPGLSYE